MRTTWMWMVVCGLAICLAGCCSADCCPLQKDGYGVRNCEPLQSSAAQVE